MYAKTVKVKNTNINGILTSPSRPSVRLVAFVDPIIIKRIKKK